MKPVGTHCERLAALLALGGSWAKVQPISIDDHACGLPAAQGGAARRDLQGLRPTRACAAGWMVQEGLLQACVMAGARSRESAVE